MKRWANILSQIFLGFGQLVNVIAPILNEHDKVLIGVAIAAVQVIISAVAHGYNVDGTPQECAYTPTEPKK